jgi:hypothetical protein
VGKPNPHHEHRDGPAQFYREQGRHLAQRRGTDGALGVISMKNDWKHIFVIEE